jgi:hypothetical protein
MVTPRVKLRQLCCPLLDRLNRFIHQSYIHIDALFNTVFVVRAKTSITTKEDRGKHDIGMRYDQRLSIHQSL